MRNPESVPCVYGGDVMRRSNRMKRILREQWGLFLLWMLKTSYTLAPLNLSAPSCRLCPR
jgi:hypothetical protein